MKKIKILMILGNLNLCDGISNYAMNYYDYLDHNIIEIDFAVVKSTIDDFYRNKIEDNGNKIYYMPTNSIKDLRKNIPKIKNIFNEKKYDIVHSHVINMGYIFFYFAKKYGVKNRILHSHTELPKEKNIYRKIRNNILIKMVNRIANIKFACSKIAGDSLFHKNDYIIIKNAIEIDKYKFNRKKRDELRQKYSLNNKLVIGHVGRFCYQKNQKFIMNIFEKIHNIKENTMLIFIGNGEDLEKIKKEAEEKEIDKNILFLGSRNDVNLLLNMIDVFILPSNFEGLPIVSIEAQANGLITLISNRVSDECKILDSTKFLNLTEEEWIEKILECKVGNDRIYDIQKLYNSNFNLKKESKRLEKIYESIYQGCIDNIYKI